MFTSRFWAELMGRLDVRLRKSTAFHPQTDGQTERVNQSLEQYLRQYCNYEQDNWYDLLPLAEYAYNNSATTATQISPFYVNYGFHPWTTWPVEKESKNPASRIYAHWIQSVHDHCLKHLEETRERIGKYYDRARKEPPPYGVGDLVMLNGKHIRTRWAAKKLDAKLFGPFKVKNYYNIIFHFMLAAFRLWHTGIHDLGIQPIFSFSLLCISSYILSRSSSFFFFLSPLPTGTIWFTL